LLFAKNDVGSIVVYLAALEAEHATCLLPSDFECPAATDLIDEYLPDIIAVQHDKVDAILKRGYVVAGGESGLSILARHNRHLEPPNEALALILTTSASSGGRKCVRLSRASVAASSVQVSAALHISETDRSVLTLPFSYVYGLSVLNSALHAGASIVLARGTPASPGYWEAVAQSQPTMVPTVSQTLEYLRWLNFDARRLPSLRGLTHSGEPLDPRLFQWMWDCFGGLGASLYLMYGQTEACGRISVLPPERVLDKHGSVGKAIPGGRISIEPKGEIVYRGAGVMLGYATGRKDLAEGDALRGVLNTGDIGRFDEEGFLYITGRSTRYCKVFGRRISLDEMEASLSRRCATAIVERGGRIVVYAERAAETSLPSIGELARQFSLPPQNFQLRVIDSFPRTERGKISYRALFEKA
jgi:acyl-coenzyme A synthetase/AMP-(fatty) acid ligase